MTISYNWLSTYLPVSIAPEKLSVILTSIGLEVESLEKVEEIRGGLEGLVSGEVISCEKHPDADKLSLTKVSIGSSELLSIVCGAPNVAAGQKVIVAPVGATIYPIHGEPFTLKKAKIRGAESQGMLCAEDEIGIGEGHDGIKILPADTIPGTPLAAIFKPGTDYIFEIGLTPNRMDAMSHLGVARDVCAWLTQHEAPAQVVTPLSPPTITGVHDSPIHVSILNNEACKRYSGVLLEGIRIEESPKWLQERLKSIGLKPINNIVDITNFILHESGQPLHAFDADKISGQKIIVQTLPAGTPFKTLDDKERKLYSTDLMICDEHSPLCMAGIYGGLHSGVTASTTRIFLESACFDSVYIRRSSVKHELRTDAATRFEKGTDISNTLAVLLRAAKLMEEMAGGKITGGITDVYPSPANKKSVTLHWEYLHKLSGKKYSPETAVRILLALGFIIEEQTDTSVSVLVPYSKTDISIPADLVEEIMRIDGLDNIAIPTSISISPSVETDHRKYALREKISEYLAGLGFREIFTNSISNTAFYDEALLTSSVKMINSLSADLNMLRPQMLESGLQVINHNLNRKNSDLRLFEFGKTYAIKEPAEYIETNHLCLYITGSFEASSWKQKSQKTDFYYLKGVIQQLMQISGVSSTAIAPVVDSIFSTGTSIQAGNTSIGKLGEVAPGRLKQFDIKQPVFYADINWDILLSLKAPVLRYREIPRFPAVNRDLAVVVDKNVSYNQVEQIALSRKISQLKSVELFDVFESDKLGAGKKSMAISFTFLDETKTLTDKEIDAFMQKIVSGYETGLQAEIRK